MTQSETMCGVAVEGALGIAVGLFVTGEVPDDEGLVS